MRLKAIKENGIFHIREIAPETYKVTHQSIPSARIQGNRILFHNLNDMDDTLTVLSNVDPNLTYKISIHIAPDHTGYAVTPNSLGIPSSPSYLHPDLSHILHAIFNDQIQTLPTLAASTTLATTNAQSL